MKREIVFDQAFLESLGRIQLLARESSGGRLEGARVSSRTGSGIEPADWRPYLPGDSPRDVDWRAFARLGRMFVRLRAREESSNVYLLVDASASMALGRPTKFTFARRVTGALAAAALTGLDAVAVGLMRAGECDVGERTTGSDRLPEVLGALEGATAGGETGLAGGLARFLDGSPERGVIVVLSDFWCEDDLAAPLAAAAERGFEGSLIQILDPSEAEPPFGGRQRLVDSESGAELEMRLSPAAREAYVAERKRFFDGLTATAARAGLRTAALETGRRLEDAVLVDLRRAGVLG